MNAEQLRQMRKSLRLKAFTDRLLKDFQESFSAHGRKKIWDSLLAMLEMEDERLCDRALEAWTDELRNSLTNADPEIRRQALSALSDLASELLEDVDVVEGFVRCLYDESESVRSQAISAIFRFRGRPAVEAISNSFSNVIYHQPVINDPDSCRFWHALFALDEAIDVTNLTSTEQAVVAQKVFEALNLILGGDPVSGMDIWKVGDSLGEHVKGETALEVLQRMARHHEPVVRTSALHGLSHLSGEKARVVVEHALSDPAAEVVAEARKALLTMKLENQLP